MRIHVSADGLGAACDPSCKPLDASPRRSRDGSPHFPLDPHRGCLFVALLLCVASIHPTSSERSVLSGGSCVHAIQGGCGSFREGQERSGPAPVLRPDAASVRLLRLRGAGWQEACWIAGVSAPGRRLRGGDGAAEALQQRMLQLKVVIPARARPITAPIRLCVMPLPCRPGERGATRGTCMRNRSVGWQRANVPSVSSSIFRWLATTHASTGAGLEYQT